MGRLSTACVCCVAAAVDREFQGTGAGRALITRLLEIAERHRYGPEIMSLGVQDLNERAWCGNRTRCSCLSSRACLGKSNHHRLAAMSMCDTSKERNHRFWLPAGGCTRTWGSCGCRSCEHTASHSLSLRLHLSRVVPSLSWQIDPFIVC